jgi:spermidine synthase
MTARGRRVFLVVYAVSGAAGLVYEVAWTRLLTLQLGHTVAAASTVLAAFMGGLAIGAWIAGARLAAAPRPPTRCLQAYALLEALVAVAALVLPLVVGASVPALAWAYADGSAPLRFTTFRIALSLLLAGVPAAAMGATFPVAAAAAAASAADAARLYAVNTLGAAAGAIAAGFWLLPALGLRGTTWTGVFLNLAAAAGALVLSTQLTSEGEAARPADKLQRVRPAKRKEAPLAYRSPGLAAFAAAISGFSALAYEVSWTRLIALVIGPTTYAFATMAAAFIAGLAGGAAIGTRIARRTAYADRWLVAFLVTGASAAVVTAWYAATEMPLSVALQVADPSVDFNTVLRQQALGVGLVLLPMTLALGATFPLTLALGADSQSIAGATARIYAANTGGAIAGALAAGFVLIPALGLRDTIRTAAFLSILGGVVVAVRARRSTDIALLNTATATLAAAPILAALVVWAVPAWDRTLLASGAYKYAPYLAGTDLEVVLRAGRLQYYKEGAAGTVSVRDLTGTRSLAIDGKVDASNSGDMLTQRLLGLLPVLIHGRAEDVAIVGLGSGVTAGTTLAVDSVKRVDVVEISPEVVEASRFFDRENGTVLARNEVRLIVGDGRSHLMLTPRRYDVIVSEPSNPWMAGVASLFTREFFEAAKSRLKPDGVMCQWAHTYDIRSNDLHSIVRTFASVFPQGSMWMVGAGDLLLIGANSEDILARFGSIAAGAKAAGVQSVLADVGAPGDSTGPVLMSLFAGGPADLDRFAGSAPIQTDDRTALEYSAPRGIYGRSRDDNSATIRGLASVRPPTIQRALDLADDTVWAARGTVDLRAQAFTTAHDAFRRAVTMNSRNVVALAGLSDAAGAATISTTNGRGWRKSRHARGTTCRSDRAIADSGGRRRRERRPGGVRGPGTGARQREGGRAAGLGVRRRRRPVETHPFDGTISLEIPRPGRLLVLPGDDSVPGGTERRSDRRRTKGHRDGPRPRPGAGPARRRVRRRRPTRVCSNGIRRVDSGQSARPAALRQRRALSAADRKSVSGEGLFRERARG